MADRRASAGSGISKKQLLFQSAQPSPTMTDNSLDTDSTTASHPKDEKHDAPETAFQVPYQATITTAKAPASEKPAERVTVRQCDSSDVERASLTLSAKPLGRARKFFLHWFTAYRVLIALVLISNATVMIFQIIAGAAADVALTATAANLLAAVVVRNEEWVNTSFAILCRIPSSIPFCIRKIIGDFHHYGGVHIGCALSSALWYCYFVALRTIEARDSPITAALSADVVTAWMFLISIVIVCVTAIPRLRVKFHNSFEQSHRFGGWTALLVLWVHTGISTLTSATVPLYKQPALWMLTATTGLIILPWTRIRRVPLTAELITPRDLKLTFPYDGMPYTSTMRLSTAPLTEWHAFATIPCADKPGMANIIVSRAGDWTTGLLTSPPSHIWLRKPAAANFLALAPIFNSLLLVGTGAGIGPLLSLLASPAMASIVASGKHVRVIWTAYGPYEPHWKFVLDTIRAIDPNPIIFDSRKGRPDVAFEAANCAAKEKIETVLVVSNPAVTREVVHEVQGRGIAAAYGAVFDS